MKTYTRTLAAIALVLTAAACSDSTNDAAPPPTTGAGATTVATTTAAPSSSAADAAPTTTPAATTTTQAPAAGEPYLFGSVGSINGPISVPGPAKAVKAYFEAWNARGGINGRPVQLIDEDGSIIPDQTAQAGQKLLTQDNVLGIVASSGFLDCSVNGPLYQSSNIAVVTLGLDPTCYTNPNIFAVTPGGSDNILPGIQHILDQGATKPYYIAINIPGTQAQADAAAAFVKASGKGELVGQSLVPFGAQAADFDAAIADAKAKGADSIIAVIDQNGMALALTSAAANQLSIADGIKWLAPFGEYNPDYISLFGEAGEGLLITVNSEPFEGGSDEVTKVAEVFKAQSVTPDGFALQGWMAAEFLEQAVNAVDGELTRESLLAAVKSLNSAKSALYPEAFDFSGTVSPQTPRAAPTAARIVTIAGGKFEVVSDWITITK
jgi:branched-chain amino acid transport system substrate-binding protein